MDWVTVPARNEEQRIGACLAALAAQPEAHAGRLGAVVVLDGCTDGTAGVVARAPAQLPVVTVVGPCAGSGPARRLGMATARDLSGGGDGALLLSTDADTRVAPDWVAAQRAALAASGAGAVGGRIDLDPAEAARLPGGVVEARAAAATGRLARVRARTPAAQHHQFSGASLGLTVWAYDRVGGVPDVPTLEDEALERALLDACVPIAYARAVRVTTSARTDGRATRGLADALAAWASERRPAGRIRPAAPRW